MSLLETFEELVGRNSCGELSIQENYLNTVIGKYYISVDEYDFTSLIINLWRETKYILINNTCVVLPDVLILENRYVGYIKTDGIETINLVNCVTNVDTIRYNRCKETLVTDMTGKFIIKKGNILVV